MKPAKPTLVLNTGALDGFAAGQPQGSGRMGLLPRKGHGGPCNVFLDGADKALAGVSSSGDSGVSAKFFGSFLSFMSDHEKRHFLLHNDGQRNFQAAAGVHPQPERFERGVLHRPAEQRREGQDLGDPSGPLRPRPKGPAPG